jgi:hypothetical protein
MSKSMWGGQRHCHSNAGRAEADRRRQPTTLEQGDRLITEYEARPFVGSEESPLSVDKEWRALVDRGYDGSERGRGFQLDHPTPGLDVSSKYRALPLEFPRPSRQARRPERA